MTRIRAAVIVALGLGFAALATAAVRLRLDTPVSVWQTDRQLPVLFWAGVVAYATLFAAVTRAPWRQAILASIGMGFAAHLLLLLSAADIQAHFEPGFFDNRAFYAYFYLVFFTSLTVAAAACGTLARRVRSVRTDRSELAAWIHLPFVGVFAYVVAEAAVRRLWPETIVALVVATTAALSIPVVNLARSRMLAILSVVDRREWIVPAAASAILFALVVSANVSLVQQLGDRFPLGFDDGDFYDDMARAVVTGTPFRPANVGPIENLWSFRTPGYPLFVTLVYWISLKNYAALGAIQGALGMLIPLTVYLVAKRLFDKAVARSAAFLTALSGLLISALMGLRSESLFAVFSAVLVWVMLTALHTDSVQRRLAAHAAGAALLAYAILIKPQAAAFVPVMLVWWIWVESRHGRVFRTLPIAIAVSVAAFALTAAPVVARDIQVNGRFTVISYGKASETWLGNHAGARLFELGVTGPSIPVFLDVFSQRPSEVLVVLWEELPRNVLEYFTGPWFGKGDPLLLERFSDFARNVTTYGHILALVGLVVGLRIAKTRPEQLLVLGYVAVNSLAPILVAYPAPRYRIPLDPLLMIWAAAGSIWVGRQVLMGHRALEASQS